MFDELAMAGVERPAVIFGCRALWFNEVQCTRERAAHQLEEFMMNFDVFVSYLMTLPQFLLMLLVLVLLDLALGVVRAVMEYEFDWEELPKFLLVCASYLLAWIAAEVLAMLPAIFGIDVAGYGEAIADVTPKLVYALIVLKYVASVVKHIRYFLSDLADA